MSVCESVCVLRGKWLFSIISNHNLPFYSFFLHLFFPPFYLVDHSNCLLSYLLWFSGSYIDTYSSIRMAQLKKKKISIIYKWTGRSASGSDGWTHWASLLFSFQSICYWFECAFNFSSKVDCVDHWLLLLSLFIWCITEGFFFFDVLKFHTDGPVNQC